MLFLQPFLSLPLLASPPGRGKEEGAGNGDLGGMHTEQVSEFRGGNEYVGKIKMKIVNISVVLNV